VRRIAALLAGVLLATAAARAADPPAKPLVLVAGGSGREGLYVLRQLRAQGLKFRATTRDRVEAGKRAGADLRGVDWVEADLRIPWDARHAMAGATDVICVIGSRTTEGANTAQFVDYGGVRNLVDAAQAAGVRHFVLLTAIGVTDPAHPFNKASKGALQWRYQGEEYLRASGVEYTIVRPAGLVNEPAGQKGVRLEQGDHWKPLVRSTISRDDLALVLIESLRNPGARRATFEIVNDETRPPGGWRSELSALQADLPR
jgi:uncharacterized protein YbjT (DUF2867 family)